MKVVLDASAATKWFVPEVGSESAMGLLRDGAEFVAPDIVLLEVGSAILRKERRKEALHGTANEALRDLDLIGVELLPHGPLLKRAAVLSTQHRQGLFDCLYLLVAQDRRLPLATFDKPMAALARRLAIPLWPEEGPPA